MPALRIGVVALAASLALLVAAGSASARIEPQRSIAGVALGMSQASVRSLLGTPRRVVRGTNDFGPFLELRYRGLLVAFQGRERVTFVSTTRRSERTATGVGVGSTERQLRRGVPAVRCTTEARTRLCVVGRQLPGRRVTAFFVERGRVTRVDVGIVID